MGKSFLLKPGEKYGKLTILKLAKIVEYINPKGRKLQKKYYECLCECGKKAIIYQGKLTSGQTKSCGCITHKHNLHNSRIYNIYAGMKKRCFSITQKDFKNYGGRGITVCDEWKNDFLTFYNWAIKNGYNDTLTLDRINYNRNYCPENCRWATPKEQANNKRSNLILNYNNESHNVTQWAEKLNIPRHLIYQRIYAGWKTNEVLSGRRHTT